MSYYSIVPLHFIPTYWQKEDFFSLKRFRVNHDAKFCLIILSYPYILFIKSRVLLLKQIFFWYKGKSTILVDFLKTFQLKSKFVCTILLIFIENLIFGCRDIFLKEKYWHFLANTSPDNAAWIINLWIHETIAVKSVKYRMSK